MRRWPLYLVLVAAIGVAAYWLWPRANRAAVQADDVAVVAGNAANPAAPAASITTSPTVTASSPASTAAATTTAAPDDGPLDKMLPDPADDPRRLHALVRSESRDAAWATASEAALKARFTLLPYIGADAMHVACAASVCEVSGMFPAGIINDNTNAAMQAIQAPSLGAALKQQGLDNRGMLFGGDKGRSTYVLFFRRVAR